MPDPETPEEHSARFNRNYRLSGFGVHEATVHMPCLFCSAPDFMVHRIVASQEAYAAGAVCQECGRGARAEIHAPDAGTLVFEFVQTVGPEPPPFVKIRRAVVN